MVGDMTNAQPSADPRVADLVKAGRVRVALYVPQYTKDPVTGALGGWCVDIVHALGAELGIKGVPVEHPNPANALSSIASGACDAGIIGIEADRATRIDYSPPIVEADYTLAGAGRLALQEHRGCGPSRRSDRRGAPSCFDHRSEQDHPARQLRVCRYARTDVPDPAAGRSGLVRLAA
jgi:hypothetical protein